MTYYSVYSIWCGSAARDSAPDHGATYHGSSYNGASNNGAPHHGATGDALHDGPAAQLRSEQAVRGHARVAAAAARRAAHRATSSARHEALYTGQLPTL